MKKYKITKRCSQLLLAIAATLFTTNTFAQTCDFTINNGGATGGDTEYFLQLDAAGNIAAVTPGPGPLNITTVATGTIVEVLHLVYDSTDPPTNVPPAVGDDPAAIVGCTNDHLSSRVILECLCVEDALTITYTPGGGDMQMYYLVDPATGAILDANTTGDFGTDEIAGDYFVQSISYDSTNPPTTLPATGGNISDFSADGCYNPDFLSSAYCGQKIVCCPDCAAATAADLMQRTCDDNDPCTINDMETIVTCSDPVEICVPCAGEAVGPPIPSLTCPPTELNICSGDPYNCMFSDQNPNTAAQTEASPIIGGPDAGVVGADGIINPSALTQGTYTFTLTYESPTGCIADPVTCTFSVAASSAQGANAGSLNGN